VSSSTLHPLPEGGIFLLKTVVTPSGFKIRGNLVGQMEKLASYNSNNNKYGITVSQILSEGYHKLDNPYLRSWGSKEEFLKTNRQFLSYIQKNFFEVKALWHLTPFHAQSYAENYLDHYSTWGRSELQKQSSQLHKLENMIQETLGYRQFSLGDKNLQSGRWVINRMALERAETHSRGSYKDPESLISSLKDADHSLFAQAQREGGFRFNELQYTREKNLKGITLDKITGEEIGVIFVHGKGGFERLCYVSPETYQKIEDIIQKNTSFHVDYNEYLRDLYSSSKDTDQDYEGSHGLRYNFAQERYDECLETGYSQEEALKKVSEDMGHHRPDITEHYLGR